MPYGHQSDPLRGFKFIVSITVPFLSGRIRLGCTRISGLRAETEVVEYREGNEFSTVRKLPGLTTYDNLVLERGQVEGPDTMAIWHDKIRRINDEGNSDLELRGDGVIKIYPKQVVLAPGGQTQVAPSMEYTFVNAWPTVYEHTDLDATASDVWFERIELAHEGLQFDIL